MGHGWESTGKEHSVAALLDEVRGLAEQQERVAIGDVVEALGACRFVPFVAGFR